jgi:hypothetical protein
MFEQSQPERRRSERHRAFLRGRITFDGMVAAIDCDIKNISDGGVAIALDRNHTVPSDFTLEIPAKGRISRMHMVWRSADRMGAAFADRPQADEDTAAIDPAARIAELEAELTALRLQVRQLRNELAMKTSLSDNAI